MSSDNNVTSRRIVIEFSGEAAKALVVIGAALAQGGKEPNITTRTNLAVEAFAALITAAGGATDLEIYVRPHPRSHGEQPWKMLEMGV
jgi:hypothetical protein